MSTESKSAAPATFDCRVAFAEELASVAREDPRVVVVCNDSIGSSNLGSFSREFADRMVNVGIAEQDMVGVAAGLANGGYVPFVCAAAPFLSGRALEQIKNDLAYSGYHAVLCGMSPGVAYGELGPTHHSIEDVAWLRAIDNVTVMVPADPAETRGAVRWAVGASGPVYLRIGRFKVPEITPPCTRFEAGTAAQIRAGRDLTIVASGVLVHRALAAAEVLAQGGLQARVLSLHTVKPIDAEALVRAAEETGRVVTVEESTTAGGMGSAVAEVLCQRRPVPMRILGVPHFAPTGSAGFLLDHFGLDAAGIVRAARELVS